MTRCVGHRGAAGLAPENTLVAFEAGIVAGADLVECDVHQTADGHLVLMHDDDVSRTTDGKGRIGALRFAEMRRLNASVTFQGASAPATVPTLEELLELASGRVQVQVEIKVPESGAYPGIEEAVVAALRRSKVLGSAQVICFDGATVTRVRALAPELRLGFLASRSSLPRAMRRDPGAVADYARSSGANFLSLNRSLIGPAYVEAAAAQGLGLAAWTVNEPAEMERFASLGLEAITSDRPDLLRRVLDGGPGSVGR